MILTAVLYLLSIVLELIRGFIAVLTFFIPTVIQNAIGEYISYARYIDGVLPMLPHPEMSGIVHSIGLLNLFAYALQFVYAMFSIKVILWFVGYLPWLNHPDIELPKLRNN